MARPKNRGRKIDDRHLRLDYLGGRCAICGRSVAATERTFGTSKGAFEFNHIDPSKKADDYENLIRRVLSADQLDELDKCNLLCRFCHGIWTNQRLHGSCEIVLPLADGRVAKKKIRHHGLLRIKRSGPQLHLFADEPCNLEVYGCRLGDDTLEARFGYQLQEELAGLMLETRRREILRISDAKGVVFNARRLDEHKMDVEFQVRFSVMKFEGKPDDGTQPHVWVRNGKAIIEGQGVWRGGRIGFGMEYSELEKAIEKGAKSSADAT